MFSVSLSVGVHVYGENGGDDMVATGGNAGSMLAGTCCYTATAQVSLASNTDGLKALARKAGNKRLVTHGQGGCSSDR